MLSLCYDPLEIQPASGLEKFRSILLKTGHAAERSNHRWDESLQALLPLGKWQLAKILSSTPQYVEGDVGQRTPTAHKIPEVDPAFIVQCHDLPVQNEVSPANSLPSCSAKLRKRVIVFSRFE
jgi:hypothetical protein